MGRGVWVASAGVPGRERGGGRGRGEGGERRRSAGSPQGRAWGWLEGRSVAACSEWWLVKTLADAYPNEGCEGEELRVGGSRLGTCTRGRAKMRLAAGKDVRATSTLTTAGKGRQVQRGGGTAELGSASVRSLARVVCGRVGGTGCGCAGWPSKRRGERRWTRRRALLIAVGVCVDRRAVWRGVRVFAVTCDGRGGCGGHAADACEAGGHGHGRAAGGGQARGKRQGAAVIPSAARALA
ncbi:hypothetical protein B0H17DRAFT_1177803 [Mycena rosella]|uniref:Uncharacterized protein n=1 Tax=Mycena rosella TaxID=1033263 RepID=A0AAD7DPM4_MYCRO|nr:hypothetical protein B0H17DRAFT_1177803 [Mycena rosella]